MPIQTGRNKHVELRRDNRERNECCAEHGKLELDNEIFKQPGIDEFRVRTSHPYEWPRQNDEDRLGEEETADERNTEGDQRLDESRPQLDQVLHQRRLGCLDVFVRHAGLLPASCVLGSLPPDGASVGAVAGGAASAPVLDTMEEGSVPIEVSTAGV